MASSGNKYGGTAMPTGAGALSAARAVTQSAVGVPTHSAPKNALYRNETTGVLYINTNGATTWAVVGGSGSPQGMPGQDGRDGEDGERGPPGATGGTGAAGADGRMGPPGWDAEPAEDFGLWVPPGLGRPLISRDLPADYKLQGFVPTALAESIPRYMNNNNGSILSSGRLSSVSIPVKAGTPCTNLSFISATTPLSVGANRWFALCDASFIPIRQTTDQLATAWGANTVMTNDLDSIPVTAGARVISATVTLTFPTLSQALTNLIAVGDSIVVSNANVAAYNGTFTVVTVSATQITYVSGGSATDVLLAPFPTVQLAAGKRVYTPAADALLYAVIMVKATVPTLGCCAVTLSSLTPILTSSGNSGLTGTVPSPITTSGGSSLCPWAGIS